jgi:hypothetical protein
MPPDILDLPPEIRDRKLRRLGMTLEEYRRDQAAWDEATADQSGAGYAEDTSPHNWAEDDLIEGALAPDED